MEFDLSAVGEFVKENGSGSVLGASGTEKTRFAKVVGLPPLTSTPATAAKVLSAGRLLGGLLAKIPYLLIFALSSAVCSSSAQLVSLLTTAPPCLAVEIRRGCTASAGVGYPCLTTDHGDGHG